MTSHQARPPDKAETLADFLHEHIGVLHSGDFIPGGARMSEASGQKFADGLMNQHRKKK